MRVKLRNEDERKWRLSNFPKCYHDQKDFYVTDSWEMKNSDRGMVRLSFDKFGIKQFTAIAADEVEEVNSLKEGYKRKLLSEVLSEGQLVKYQNS